MILHLKKAKGQMTFRHAFSLFQVRRPPVFPKTKKGQLTPKAGLIVFYSYFITHPISISVPASFPSPRT